MKLVKVVFVFVFLLIAGCGDLWRADKTPRFRNQTGQSITVQLVFDDSERTYTIGKYNSLSFPDILKEASLVSINLIDHDGQTRSFSKRELINLMNAGNRFFVIGDNLSVKPQGRFIPAETKRRNEGVTP